MTTITPDQQVLTPATPPTDTAGPLYAVSLLLSTPESHAAATVISNDPAVALAVALRSADRERPGEVQTGSVTPIPIDMVATALLRWLRDADAATLTTLVEDLLANMPADQVRSALTTLQEAVKTIEARRQESRQRRLGRRSAGSAEVPAIAA